MPSILAHSSGDLDFDRLIAALIYHCPGSRVVDQDYHATRIAKERDITRDIMGLPCDNPIVACAVEASDTHGITRQIRVALADGTELTGTVSRLGILLCTKAMLTSNAVASVLTALAEFPGLRLETLGIQN